MPAINACGAFGLLTMWTTNPICVLSISAISLWSMSRWTMIAHHTCHGGYNRQDDGSGRFSKGFALGSFVRARDCELIAARQSCRRQTLACQYPHPRCLPGCRACAKL